MIKYAGCKVEETVEVTAEVTVETTAGTTLTVSKLHVAPVDLLRLRQGCWPLRHGIEEHQVWLALPHPDKWDDAQLGHLVALGFSRYFLDLVHGAMQAENEWLLIDDKAEADDKLLIFVG